MKIHEQLITVGADGLLSALSREDRFQFALYRACGIIDVPLKRASGDRSLNERDMVFSAVMRAFHSLSSREMGARLISARETGFIGTVPHFNTLLKFLRDEENRQHFIRPASLMLSILQAHYPVKLRRYRRRNWTFGRRFFSRTMTGLIGEMLCVKFGEMIDKLVWFEQDRLLPERSGFDQKLLKHYAKRDHVELETRAAAELRVKPVITNVDLLLKKVEAAIPKTLFADIREDVFQEIALAILDGEIDQDRIEGTVNKYIRKIFKLRGSKWTDISLDHPQFAGNDERALIEKLAA